MLDVFTLLGWLVLILPLAVAAGLAVLAYLVPKTTLFWVAAGALALSLVVGAIVQLPLSGGLTALAGVLGIVAAVFGGAPAATTSLRLAMAGSAEPGLHGGILVSVKDATDHPGAVGRKREVLRGGLTIGILERIAAAGTIIAGFPEGLAIVVAVKGVGRFTELDAPEARERFIIGTFASLIWACAAALAVRLAVG